MEDIETMPFSGRNLIIQVGGPRRGGEGVEGYLRRVAQQTGIGFSSILKIWKRQYESKPSIRALQTALIEKKKNDDYACAHQLERLAAECETTDPLLYQSHVRIWRRSAALVRELAETRRPETPGPVDCGPAAGSETGGP